MTYETERTPPTENEVRDVLAERRLVHRILLAIAILIPAGVVVFGALTFVAARIAGVAEGGPTAMGAAIGVLSGLFFGVWAGVVASANDMEQVEAEEMRDAHTPREQLRDRQTV